MTDLNLMPTQPYETKSGLYDHGSGNATITKDGLYQAILFHLESTDGTLETLKLSERRPLTFRERILGRNTPQDITDTLQDPKNVGKVKWNLRSEPK